MSEMGQSAGQSAGQSSNPLMPPAGVDVAGPAAGGGGTGGLVDGMQSAHGALAARYAKIKETEGRISIAREVMDQLAEMQDTVTQEDVVKGAGRIVAKGGGAAEIAGLLAEMPPEGEALAGWVKQKDQGLRRIEALLEEKMTEARYQLGVSALQHIASVQAHQQFGQPQGQAPLPVAAAGNQLLGGVE